MTLKLQPAQCTSMSMQHWATSQTLLKNSTNKLGTDYEEDSIQGIKEQACYKKFNQEVGCKENIDIEGVCSWEYQCDYDKNRLPLYIWRASCGSKFLCSLSVHVTLRSSNAILGPVEARKLSFRLCVISYRLFALAKTDAENCNTYPRLQTDSGRFAFRFCGPWGRHQESYLPVPRLSKEHGQKLEYNSLIYYSCELWPCMGGTLSRNLKGNTNINLCFNFMYFARQGTHPLLHPSPWSTKVHL